MNLLIYFLKTKQLSISRGVGFKGATLFVSYPLNASVVFILKTINLT